MRTKTSVRMVNADTMPHFLSLLPTKKERMRLFELEPHDSKACAEAKKASRSLFIVADLLWARESSTIRCGVTFIGLLLWLYRQCCSLYRQGNVCAEVKFGSRSNGSGIDVSSIARKQYLYSHLSIASTSVAIIGFFFFA